MKKLKNLLKLEILVIGIPLLIQYCQKEGGQHEILLKLVSEMSTVLQNYDNQIFTNFEDYKILASQGVFDLTSSQKSELNAVKTKARNNDKKCNN